MTHLVMWEKQEIRSADELLEVLKSVQATSEAELIMEEVHLYGEDRSAEISLTHQHCVLKVTIEGDEDYYYVMQDRKLSQQLFQELGAWSPKCKEDNADHVYGEEDVDFVYYSSWNGHGVQVWSPTIIRAEDGIRLCLDFFYGDFQLPDGWTKMGILEHFDTLQKDQ